MFWGPLLLLIMLYSEAVAIRLPNIKVLKHSPSASQDYLGSLQDAPFNHKHAGKSIAFSMKDAADMDHDQAPPSFLPLQKRVRIGRGMKDFERASEYLLDFGMTNDLSWADVVINSEDGKPQVGTIIGTLVKCYKLVWSLNPCRIVDIQKGINNGGNNGFRYSQVAFSTLEGHLISGEERFRVLIDTNIGSNSYEEVFLDLYSFTKGGSALLGGLSMSLIRPLQVGVLVLTDL